MESLKFLKSILKGLLCAIIVTILCMIILSIVMTKFDLSDKSYNIAYVAVNCFGLVVGTVIAAKIAEKRGWLVGLMLGIFFFGFLMLLNLVINGEVALGQAELYKFGGCVIVGSLAGMLGVNL